VGTAATADLRHRAGRHRRRPGARLRHRGDSFDYAVNGSTADLAIFDSVGHGLPAAVLASVAVAAYRHARRGRADLPDIAAEINTTISGRFGASQFVTALLARLDLDTGRLRWVNAGHPEPLVLRGMSLVQLPHRPPDRPLACRSKRRPATRPGSNPVIACCSTLMASPRRALPMAHSSVSSGSRTW